MDDGFFLVALMEESNRDVKREGVKGDSIEQDLVK